MILGRGFAGLAQAQDQQQLIACIRNRVNGFGEHRARTRDKSRHSLRDGNGAIGKEFGTDGRLREDGAVGQRQGIQPYCAVLVLPGKGVGLPA